MTRLLLLWPHCSSWLPIAFPGTETTMVPLSQTCCIYLSPLPTCSESRALLCNINSLSAKQEVIFLLIGRIPAVCGSVLSAGRPCGSTKVLERQRKNAGRQLFLLSVPRSVVSVHQPSCVCVWGGFIAWFLVCSARLSFALLIFSVIIKAHVRQTTLNFIVTASFPIHECLPVSFLRVSSKLLVS